MQSVYYTASADFYCRISTRNTKKKIQQKIFVPVFFFWELIFFFFFLRINFYLLRTFCPHLGSFFCVVSSFTMFRPNFTSGLLQVIFTTTSDRNDESCNRIISKWFQLKTMFFFSFSILRETWIGNKDRKG